jgi:hypothetical protein
MSAFSARNANSSRCSQRNKLRQSASSSQPILHTSTSFCQYTHPSIHCHSIHSQQIVNRKNPCLRSSLPLYLPRQLCGSRSVSVLSMAAPECLPKPVVCAKDVAGFVVKDVPPARIVQVPLPRYRPIHLHQRAHLLHHFHSSLFPPQQPRPSQPHSQRYHHPSQKLYRIYFERI